MPRSIKPGQRSQVRKLHLHRCTVMIANVSWTPLGAFKCTNGTTICPIDPVQPRLLFKGLPLRISWDINRWICLAHGHINPGLEYQGGRYSTKRLVDYGSSGKSKGQSDRYSYTPVWCRKVNIFIYISPRICNVYYLTFFASQSWFLLQENDGVNDITRNIHNFCPTFELREQFYIS
jgi:hypothetical protein